MSALTDQLLYHSIDGSPDLVRRGLFVPPLPAILANDFESMSLISAMNSNPAGVNALRTATGDTDLGYLDYQHCLMSIQDYSGDGRGFTVRYQDGWYMSGDHTVFGNNTGVAYVTDLPRQVNGCRIRFIARFRSGFTSSKGGKFGPGIGWRNQWANSPSTGGASNNYAGSFRMMWRDLFRLSPYLYDANGTAGIGFADSTVNTPDDFDFHEYEIDIIMNTASIPAGPFVNGGSPASPGALGTDYLADGAMIARVDGSEYLNRSNRVHRKYQDTHIKNMTWSWFRGGGDTTWDATGGPDYIDMLEYEVTEL